MEATIKMPIVVEQQRQNDYASANSDLSGFGSSFHNLEIIKRGNEQYYRLYRSPNFTSFDNKDELQEYLTTNFAVLKDSAETTIFDADFSNSINKNLVTNEDEEFDDSLFYGVQVIDHPRKVLFSQEVEITTSGAGWKFPNRENLCDISIE